LRRRWWVQIVLTASMSASGFAADSISGVVRNQTRNEPAAGDQVILVRLDQSVEEEARTRTDEFGAFTVKIQVPEKPHLIRIVHQGVNYDRQTSPGESLTVDVFDSATKVQGITGVIEIIRTGTNGMMLHVSDMIEIKNDSRPPITQVGERTFDVYLPAAARMDSVMAATSDKIGVLIAASPVRGEPGHYTVNIPLRPGSTKFAFNYDLPYSGRAYFHTRLAYPVEQLAVMIPPTMKFRSRSSTFQLLDTGSNDYQVQATNRLKAGNGPSFEVSGAGGLPPLLARAQPPPESQPAAPDRSARTRGTPRPQPPPDKAPPPPVNEWWILGAAAILVLGASALSIWRTGRNRSLLKTETKRHPTASLEETRSAGKPSAPLLDALKEHLLELETSRLDGSISPEEYRAAKRALQGTFKRALARSAGRNRLLSRSNMS
jgi:hypothetical protein